MSEIKSIMKKITAVILFLCVLLSYTFTASAAKAKVGKKRSTAPVPGSVSTNFGVPIFVHPESSVSPKPWSKDTNLYMYTQWKTNTYHEVSVRTPASEWPGASPIQGWYVPPPASQDNVYLGESDYRLRKYQQALTEAQYQSEIDYYRYGGGYGGYGNYGYGGYGNYAGYDHGSYGYGGYGHLSGYSYPRSIVYRRAWSVGYR